ncbi:MAG: hypothetical protein ABI758_06855 [Candidatus Woesebacteria bacterium]
MNEQKSWKKPVRIMVGLALLALSIAILLSGPSAMNFVGILIWMASSIVPTVVGTWLIATNK